MFLKISQNSQGNTCSRVSLIKSCRPQPCNFIKEETLTEVFSCPFCEIFTNTFFREHLRWLLLHISVKISQNSLLVFGIVIVWITFKIFGKYTRVLKLATHGKGISNNTPLKKWNKTQLTFTCSKSKIETLEKGVKYVQRQR